MRLGATGWVLLTFTSGKAFLFNPSGTVQSSLMMDKRKAVCVEWGLGVLESVSRPVDSVCLTALFHPVSARVFPQI